MFNTTEDNQYLLCENYLPLLSEGERVSITLDRSKMSSQYSSFIIERRLHLLERTTTQDAILLYMNYIALLYETSNRKTIGEVHKSLYTENLDLGYVPIICPQCTIDSKELLYSQAYYKIASDRLRAKNIPFIQNYPMNLDGRRVSAEVNDIWVNRLDIASHQGTTVTSLNLLKFIAEVIA